MNRKFILGFAAFLLCLTSCGNGDTPTETVFPELTYSVTKEDLGEGKFNVTDMVGRKVEVTPGSYERVVCIGAGALRLYSYVGNLDLLCGVEDIDNPSLESRPKMFDNVPRPYLLAGKDKFETLPSCGVGGPQAQAAEAEKILSCRPDIVISEYEDADKENALQEQLGVPVITLRLGSAGMVNTTVYSSLALLGFVFNEDARAKDIIEYHYFSTKDVFDLTKKVSSRKKGYACGLGNWGTTDQFMTAQNYDVFNFAHINNVVTGLPKDGVQKIEEEKFTALAKDMEVMVFDAAAVKNIKGKNFDFSICKAFQTGEVYLQMAYNAYYTNVETALINTWFVASVTYPELFPAFDIAKKADEITLKFNRKALYAEMKALPQAYGGYQKIANPTEFFK